MLKTFQYFILPILLFSHLVSIPNVGSIYWMIPSNVSMWIACALLVILACVVVLQTQEFLFKKSQVYLFVFVIALFSFGVINSDFSQQNLMIYFFGMFFVAIFYIALGQFKFSDNDVYFFMFVLVVFGAIQALIGVIQIYDYEYRLFHLWFGYEPFRIVGGATGAFQQPNMLASFLSLALISGFLLLFTKEVCEYSKLKLLVFYLCLVVMFFVLFKSGSRAAILSFTIPMFLVFWVNRNKLRESIKGFLLFIFAFVLAISLIQLVDASQTGLGNVIHKSERIANGGDVRFHLYGSALNMFFESPWFGYGIGGYPEAFKNYYSAMSLPNALSQEMVNRMTHPHNEFLFWMVQSGLIALVGLTLFLFLFFKNLDFSSNRTITMVLLALPVVIQAQFSYPFGLSAPHLFLLLIFMALAVEKRNAVKIGFKTSLVTLSGASILSIVVILMGSSVYASILETHYFYNRMKLYKIDKFQGYEEKGYFNQATNNIFFSDFVDRAMLKMFERAIDRDNFYDIKQFVKWSENNKKTAKPEYIAAKKILDDKR